MSTSSRVVYCVHKKLIFGSNAISRHFLVAERGVQYEFRVSAANAVDFGEAALRMIRTPDGG